MTDKQDEATETIEVEGAEEVRDPTFLGDFDAFDHVRGYCEEAGLELIPGDLALVNGALVQVGGDSAFTTLLTSLVDEYSLPSDHTERFARSITDLERVVLEAAFEDGSLLENMRDTVLALFKAKPKLWPEMSQIEQRDTAKQIEAQSRTILRKIARVMAEGDEIAVTGKLERYTHAGGAFDLKLSAASDEESAIELYRMVGHDVVIVSADAERFMTNTSEAETEPDQADLVDLVENHELVEDDDDETEIPDDDSDLAGDDNEGDDEPTLKKPSHGDVKMKKVEDFEEAGDEELSQQSGRPGAEGVEGDDSPEADYNQAEEPENPEFGASWYNPDGVDGRVRYYHGDDRWLLKKPSAAEIAENDEAGPASDDARSDADELPELVED